MKKKELEIATTTYTVAYKKGYSQCQEDMADKKYSINDFLNMIKEYKDKNYPTAINHTTTRLKQHQGQRV